MNYQEDTTEKKGAQGEVPSPSEGLGGAPRLEDGGPAFPTLNSMEPGDYGRFIANTAGGLSLRDYFAAKALQGLLANPNVVGYNANCGWGPVNCTWEQIANTAIDNADAMLQARRTT